MIASVVPAGFRSLPIPIAQLSLAAVLKCGQSFRWNTLNVAPREGADPEPLIFNVEYRFALKDRVICLRQNTDTLFYRTVFSAFSESSTSATDLDRLRDAETITWLKDYFQLDVDLVKLYDTWEQVDPVFAKLRDRFTGIRMLRQDPWENLISFICSQNNHISRITKMVQALCTHFSPPLVSIPHPNPAAFENVLNDPIYHPFPSPFRLAAPETSEILRSLGFGYRAEYIQRTAQMLIEVHGEQGAEEFLKSLRHKPTDEARTELLKFVGVGRKVADCVLLMSLDKRDVVPVDTHVHQIAMKHYGLRRGDSGAKATMTPKLYDEVQTKLSGVWGNHAGWAHSVLFTADLKSFSTYGLPTPSPSISPEKPKEVSKRKSMSDPSARLTKRNRTIATKIVKISKELPISDSNSESGDLADRVKRRRRRNLITGYVESM